MESFKQYLSESEGKSLYIKRLLLNSDKLEEWAKEQGFKVIVSPKEMHVTLIYCKEKVNWNKITPNTEKYVSKNYGRKVERLGDKGAIVLIFKDDTLQKRFKEIIDAGAKSDYDVYRSHVTITYHKDDALDLSKIKPYDGQLVFGPEIRNEIDEDWGDKVKHKKTE